MGWRGGKRGQAAVVWPGSHRGLGIWGVRGSDTGPTGWGALLIPVLLESEQFGGHTAGAGRRWEPASSRAWGQKCAHLSFTSSFTPELAWRAWFIMSCTKDIAVSRLGGGQRRREGAAGAATAPGGVGSAQGTTSGLPPCPDLHKPSILGRGGAAYSQPTLPSVLQDCTGPTSILRTASSMAEDVAAISLSTRAPSSS